MNTNRSGEIFLQHVRDIIDDCSKLESPERAARVTAFAICVMLDGSGEHCGPEYVLSVKNENDGIDDPVKFFHHDL